MEKVILSKSTYIRSLQCLKSLYLYKNNYNLKDAISEDKQAIFQRGINVGQLAQKLFPGGVELKPSYRDYNKGFEETQLALIENTTIYEASFIYNNVYVAADIVQKAPSGNWNVYEVKSSVRLTNTYINDAALQYYVIKNAGIAIENFYLILIDPDYIRGKELDLAKLFSVTCVTDRLIELQDRIVTQVNIAKNALAESQAPEIGVGEHCFSPYDCDFKGHCWSNLPKESVFELSGVSKKDQLDLYNQGIVKITDIKDSSVFKKSTQTQIDSAISNNPTVDKDGLNQFIGQVKYPIYFLDFETFMPAVPYFEGNKPYQHTPFQYSLHIYKDEKSTLEHKEFLAEPFGDPRIPFMQSLINDLGVDGTILVYNISFERQILKDLIKKYPVYADKLKEITNRMVDLIIPFENKYYYHPAMKGSHSMKYVLPALFPELSYDKLVIKSGAVAMMAFEKLYHENDIIKICETKDALKEYCKLDTLGMVKIFDYLRNVVA
ncbi:MAG: DUF2779 domain-containing protein [Bacteroidetes bacterium]|nr:DUF2779 domain-containing protein [Bacteroidota bacterium]